jgi:hypothetical protein
VTRLRDRCTDLIGDGVHRTVYTHPDNPELVVKIAKKSESHRLLRRKESDFSNSMEWRVWTLAAGTEFEVWFVPCVSLSDDLIELVQYRAKPTRTRPKDHPKWFADVKTRNWGIWNGRPRLVDYANRDYLAGLEAAL